MLRFQSFIYFLSYTRSLKCGQLQDWKTWVGVYVKCYCFSIFVVVDSVYYKYQYSKTYTLCCGLNRLQVYVTEIKEKQIFERIRWQTWALFECVFYKFAVPVVGCLTVAAGILARSEEVSKGTGTNQRFVKNALKNAELPPDSLKYLFFFYFRYIHVHFKSILFLPINLCYD